MQTLQPSFLKRSWPYFLLTALVVLFLGDVWFGGRMLLLRDFFFGTETQFLTIGKALRHGTFPLWSSSVQCGIPFAASPYHAAFYLPNWIFILPSTELAIRLLWTFHLALAAISFYALARYWRMGIGPSLFGAVSFAFCTFTATWLEFSLSMTWALVAMLLISRLIDTTAEEVLQNAEAGTPLRLWPIFLRNAAFIAGLAVALALPLLASGEFFYYSALLLAAYGVARWTWHGSWKVCAISLLWLGGAGLLALALAAPQLFLTMELMGFSDRVGEVDSAANMASAHPRQWLAFLLPFLYGRPGYPNAYWAPTIYEFGIGHCYVGILPLVAAFFCWLRSKGAAISREAREWRFLTCFFSAVLLGGMLMVAGKYTPVYGFLHHWLPGLGHFRFPVKFYFVVAFALSMLGALGFQSLLVAREKSEEDGGRIRLWKIVAGIFGVFLLGYLVCLLSDSFLPWLMAHPSTPSVAQINATMADYTWAVVFTLLGLGLFALLSFRRGPARWIQAGIVAVAFLNLCVISRQTQPTGPAGIYTRRPEALAKRIGTDPMNRYFSTYYSAQQYLYGDERPEMWEWAVDAAATNHLLQEGLCSLTPGGLSVTRYSQIFGAIMSAPRPIGEKFADMLSMRYVIGGAPFEQILWGNAPREARVSERPTSLPRAFVIGQWLPMSGETQVAQAIVADSFDPHKVAIVEPLAGETVPPSPASASSEPAGEVRVFADHGNSVTLEVEAKRNALLVLGDTFYPGWSVRVDGIKRPIFQTNYLFRGVFLEPGTHHVEFIFTPTNFALGLWICALAAATCGVMVWISRRFVPSLPVPTKATKPARQ